MTIKERILEALTDLPEDATIEEAIYRLRLLAKIDRGLAQEGAGATLSHDQVRRPGLRSRRPGPSPWRR